MTTLQKYEHERRYCVDRVKDIHEYLKLSKYDPVVDTRWQPNGHAVESMQTLAEILDEAVDYYKQ